MRVSVKSRPPAMHLTLTCKLRRQWSVLQRGGSSLDNTYMRSEVYGETEKTRLEETFADN